MTECLLCVTLALSHLVCHCCRYAAEAHDDAVPVRKWTDAVDELLAALDHARSIARTPRDAPDA